MEPQMDIHNMPECNSATAVGVRLAHESAVLVARGGAQGALRSGLIARWHVARAASLAVALGTAEVSRQALHAHSLLVRLAACLRVPVVSRVGERRHLCLLDTQSPTHCTMRPPQSSRSSKSTLDLAWVRVAMLLRADVS